MEGAVNLTRYFQIGGCYINQLPPLMVYQAGTVWTQVDSLGVHQTMETRRERKPTLSVDPDKRQRFHGFRPTWKVT